MGANSPEPARASVIFLRQSRGDNDMTKRFQGRRKDSAGHATGPLRPLRGALRRPRRRRRPSMRRESETLSPGCWSSHVTIKRQDEFGSS